VQRGGQATDEAEAGMDSAVIFKTGDDGAADAQQVRQMGLGPAARPPEFPQPLAKRGSCGAGWRDQGTTRT
jgi:hypothetical protein